MFLSIYYLQNNYDDDDDDNVESNEQDIENGEELKEITTPITLIENLTENSQHPQTLIPDLQMGNNEPNYENMDTLALLASLNLQEPKPVEENNCLLPNLK